MTSARWPAVLAACASVACGSDSLELPTPPDAARTDELLAIYEQPTGTIDADALQVTAEQAIDQLSEQQLLAWSERVASGLAGLRDRLDASAMPTDPDAPEDSDRARLQAVVTLSRVCGDRAEPPDVRANGTFTVTAMVEDGVLARQVWGRASACRTSLGEAEANGGEPGAVVLDAVVLAYLYDGLPTSLLTARFLLRFGAALQVGSERATAELDLRLIDGRLEFRHGLADGDIVAGIDANVLTLRARNATFTCHIDTLDCH